MIYASGQRARLISPYRVPRGGGAFNLGRRIPSRRLFEVCAGTGLKSEPLAVGGSRKSNAGVQRSAGLQAAGSAVTCGH